MPVYVPMAPIGEAPPPPTPKVEFVVVAVVEAEDEGRVRRGPAAALVVIGEGRGGRAHPPPPSVTRGQPHTAPPSRTSPRGRREGPIRVRPSTGAGSGADCCRRTPRGSGRGLPPAPRAGAFWTDCPRQPPLPPRFVHHSKTGGGSAR